jgi:hypothetical protein
MPFKSEAQRRFLWAKHPDIAERWTKETKETARREAMKSKLKKVSKNSS